MASIESLKAKVNAKANILGTILGAEVSAVDVSRVGGVGWVYFTLTKGSKVRSVTIGIGGTAETGGTDAWVDDETGRQVFHTTDPKKLDKWLSRSLV